MATDKRTGDPAHVLVFGPPDSYGIALLKI